MMSRLEMKMMSLEIHQVLCQKDEIPGNGNIDPTALI